VLPLLSVGNPNHINVLPVLSVRNPNLVKASAAVDSCMAKNSLQVERKQDLLRKVTYRLVQAARQYTKS
jgi:hypothetical protein